MNQSGLVTLRRKKHEPLLWLMPAIAIFAVFMVYPIVFSFVLSLFQWKGYSIDIFEKFVGLKNYARLLRDPLYWLSFRNTLIVVANVVLIQNGIALVLALVFYFNEFRAGDLMRGIIFFPGMVSAVVVGLVFRIFLAMDGAVNILFDLVGLHRWAQPWLSIKGLTIWIASFITVWQWVGYNLVIFYAGLQSVDVDLLESAVIDGANRGKIIRRIIIPIMKPIIFLSALLNFIGGFRVYDIIWITTRGGPVHSSEVLTTYMYYNSFQSRGPSDMSYAAAIAVTLMVVVLVFGVVRIAVLQRDKG
jgi:ABC-type sugar transport system permease subunit